MQTKYIKSLVLSIILALSVVVPVSAARQTSTSSKLGIDISYPQCGRSVPTTQAFGIVGVNGGNAATTNPCLSDQLVWASKSSGVTPGQEKVQLYVNTANPGQVMDQMSTKWPDSNTAPATNPHGICSGQNDQACSWQYGWDRGQYAVDYFVSKASTAGINVAPSTYKWWLDVETMNTWQTGSERALANNAAALEGWASYFNHINARVGIYSTASQWNTIVGNSVKSGSSLLGLENWRPGGATQSTAKQACTATPLTPGGKVIMTQFVSKSIDYNYSCI